MRVGRDQSIALQYQEDITSLTMVKIQVECIRRILFGGYRGEISAVTNLRA